MLGAPSPAGCGEKFVSLSWGFSTEPCARSLRFETPSQCFSHGACSVFHAHPPSSPRPSTDPFSQLTTCPSSTPRHQLYSAVQAVQPRLSILLIKHSRKSHLEIHWVSVSGYLCLAFSHVPQQQKSWERKVSVPVRGVPSPALRGCPVESIVNSRSIIRTLK